MLTQNQFISPEELVTLHLKELLARRSSNLPNAQQASSVPLLKVIDQVEQGICPISQQQQDAATLLSPQLLTDSQKRMIINRKKKNDRSQLNKLLYSDNKNKIIDTQGSISQRLLSLAEHQKFIKGMREDNLKRQQERLQKQRKDNSLREAREESERKSTEAERIQSIQKRKQAIKQNLQKMRENHEKLIISEQQSRIVFHNIRKKKRLYQQMKEQQDEKLIELEREVEKRIKQRKAEHALNLHQIYRHERDYLERKKQSSNEDQNKLKKREGSQSHQAYHPPPHSSKIAKFLEQQRTSYNQFDIKKKKIADKLQKIEEYSSFLKEKIKKQSPIKTTATERNKSANSQIVNSRVQVNRNQLGNEYLKQAKLKSRKRSKTEERYFNPEKGDEIQEKLKSLKEKARTLTLDYVPQNKRKAHVEKMKKQEIQKLLKAEQMSEGDRLKRLKIADDRLSRELKKKEGEMKTRYTAQTSESTLALLLGTIRAKINLMDAYNG